MVESVLTSVEFCAGAGGQALGLERAGFEHRLLLDNDPDCCATLRANRPSWNVIQSDMRHYSPPFLGDIDLFAAGLPCPPFSVAGKQLGHEDERDLFPAAFRLIEEIKPRAVLIENVRGFLSETFRVYRRQIASTFSDLGYVVDWKLIDARDFGVSQTRSRVAIVAAREDVWGFFKFPTGLSGSPPTVGQLLADLMQANGWRGAKAWSRQADRIAPTIVGGSKKHGGPDLGPTRARLAWKALGVNGGSIAESAPAPEFVGLPRLTTRMVARVQGFPDDWIFTGAKTASYRQVGNAFPPPVAQGMAEAIRAALLATNMKTAHDGRVAAE